MQQAALQHELVVEAGGPKRILTVIQGNAGKRKQVEVCAVGSMDFILPALSERYISPRIHAVKKLGKSPFRQ